MTTTTDGSKCGATTAKGGSCEKPAGWGRPGLGGKCAYHAGRENGGQPDASDDPPPPPAPDHLDEDAAEMWDSIHADYVLSPAENRVLLGGLEAWMRYRQATEKLDAEGLTVEGANGQVKRHPACTVARNSYADFRAALGQLGLDRE